MDEKLTIAQKIRIIRVNLGWSQLDLAKHIKKTVAMVSKYENGDSIPPGDVLDMIYALKGRITHARLEF